jgi:hypothetical protein
VKKVSYILDAPHRTSVVWVSYSGDLSSSLESFTFHAGEAILREGRGRQWDGEIVDAFLRSIADRLEEPVMPTLWLVPQPEAVLQPAAIA